MSRLQHPFKAILWLAALAWLLSACRAARPLPSPTGALPPTGLLPSVSPSDTPTPFLPSPTPVPLVALVNGEGIMLAEFQAELARYQVALNDPESEAANEAQATVLEDLINQVLLAQGAAAAGFSLSESELRARLEDLASRAGGEGALAAWMAANGYTAELFESALARSIAAAWMRDQILASVPETAEQVHARQILLFSGQEAEDVLARLEAGEDFASLAAEFDPATQGDLGWFPRGYLTVPELEEAAFSLEPEQYSQVVESRVGFHIVQVIERDAQRRLDPDARLALQMQALNEWLEARRSESEIQIMLPEQEE